MFVSPAASGLRPGLPAPPGHPPPQVFDARALGPGLDALDRLLRGRRAMVLTGAGLSTDSGIPDYRGPETRHRARNPIRYNAFVDDGDEGDAARQRYWARASRGWPRFAGAQPNANHAALVRLEAAGHVAGIVTQNVDGLHQRAGSRRVVELHGSLYAVRCLGCDYRTDRHAVQRALLAMNPGFDRHLLLEITPDGDVEIDPAVVATFRAPACPYCDGALKPDVVFFGESVPLRTSSAAWDVYDAADVLLVAGSSLAVYSGLRFVHRAAKDGKPVALVTLGETRGDACCTLKLDAPLAAVLPALADRLAG